MAKLGSLASWEGIIYMSSSVTVFHDVIWRFCSDQNTAVFLCFFVRIILVFSDWLNCLLKSRMIDSLDLSGLQPTAYLDSRVGPPSLNLSATAHLPRRHFRCGGTTMQGLGHASCTWLSSIRFYQRKPHRDKSWSDWVSCHTSPASSQNSQRLSFVRVFGYRQGRPARQQGTTRARNCLPLQC